MIVLGLYLDSKLTEIHQKHLKLASQMIQILEKENFEQPGMESIDSVLNLIIDTDQQLTSEWFDVFIVFGVLVFLFGMPDSKPNKCDNNEII